MKRFLRIPFIVLIVCLFAGALAGCGSSAPSKSSESLPSFEEDASDSSIDALYQATGVKDILIIGDDAWEDYTPGSADLMCIFHVDFDNNSLTEITVPRDVAWTKEDGSVVKLNSVYKSDGAEAQMKAVSTVTGIPLNFYTIINFEGFETIVDYFNGVDVDLPYPVDYSFYTYDHPEEYFDAGEQTVDGWRAMVLSRARTTYQNQGIGYSDCVRQFVNRSMITDLIQKAYNNPIGIKALFGIFEKDIKSNIPTDVLVNWAEELGKNGEIVVRGTTGPFAGGESAQAGGAWVANPDPNGWAVLVTALNQGGDLAEAIMIGYADPDFPPGVPAVSEVVIPVAGS